MTILQSMKFADYSRKYGKSIIVYTGKKLLKSQVKHNDKFKPIITELKKKAKKYETVKISTSLTVFFYTI